MLHEPLISEDTKSERKWRTAQWVVGGIAGTAALAGVYSLGRYNAGNSINLDYNMFPSSVDKMQGFQGQPHERYDLLPQFVDGETGYKGAFIQQMQKAKRDFQRPELTPAAGGPVKYKITEMWESNQGPQRHEGNRLTPIVPVPEGTTDPMPFGQDASLTLRINADDVYQEVIGFGGGVTQAVGATFDDLKTDDLREKTIDLFFSGNGIDISIARVPINSCDFAPHHYSLDDEMPEGVKEDWDLEYFDDAMDEDAFFLFPIAKAAIKAGGNHDVQFLASPWSPPAWMKSNHMMEYPGEPQGLIPKAAPVWATYISRWMADWQNNGINITMMTVQNEPRVPVPWEGCAYTPESERDFVADYLGPALTKGAASGAHHPIKIFGYEDQKDDIELWSDVLIGEGSASAPWLEGIAFHWYAGSHFNRVTAVKNKYPQFTLLGTESTYELSRVGDKEADPGSPDHYKFVMYGLWHRGEGYAHAIIGDMFGGSSGWIDWNILLASNGGPNHLDNRCDAPVVADKFKDKIHIHPQFWYLGHFSKFVPPGSHRIGLYRADGFGMTPRHAKDIPEEFDFNGPPVYGQCDGSPDKAIAFARPSGTIVLVVMNCGNTPTYLKMEGVAGPTSGYYADYMGTHSIRTYMIDAI
jgi:glucosylceramidase